MQIKRDIEIKKKSFWCVFYVKHCKTTEKFQSEMCIRVYIHLQMTCFFLLSEVTTTIFFYCKI